MVTNDIYTTEDADFLRRAGVLTRDRIRAVQTGCCPHTAIRDDIAANLDAVEDLEARFGPLDLVLVESGGDNLTATFCRGLVDLQIFVLDVSGGDKVPRKGGPGVTSSDLLVINKTDLAPLVGATLDVMDRDARRGARGAPGDLQLAARRPAGHRGHRLGAGRRRQACRALGNGCAMTVPVTVPGPAPGPAPGPRGRAWRFRRRPPWQARRCRGTG